MGREMEKIHGVPVLPMGKFEELARSMSIVIGVLTVPAERAQQIAELMVRSGIQAIWNFAPAPLKRLSSAAGSHFSAFQSLQTSLKPNFDGCPYF